MNKLIILTLCLTLTNCTSKKIRREVNKEIKQEKVTETNEELYEVEKEAILQNESITSRQKEKLNILISKSKNQNELYDDQIMQVKSVLFKTLLDKKSPMAKINYLENQLLKLNKKRSRQTFSNYREARDILGKNEKTLDRTLYLLDRRRLGEF